MFVGSRRRYLALLVLAGLGQAGFGAAGAIALKHAFHTSPSGSPLVILTVVVLAALGIGLLRMAERILAEKLSQRYVHVLRGSLMRATLDEPATRSLGVTVARTTNDLTSVRNWMALGVAPLASGIPLILGGTLALALLNPVLAVAAMAPLLALGISLTVVAPLAYRRSRSLRRLRGRLAGQIADTVLAASTIRAAGGQRRELRRIRNRSRAVVEASIARARAAGALRGLAAAASGVATATVVGAGLYAQVPVGTIAGAITIVGILAAPVQDLGRVVEYRQMYRAARRVIEPALSGAALPSVTGKHRDTDSSMLAAAEPSVSGLAVRGLRLTGDVRVQDLEVDTGARVVVEAQDRHLATEALEVIAGLRPLGEADVRLNGLPLETLDPAARRRLIGFAAQGMRLERGALSRAVRYRVPDTDDSTTEEILRRFGLQSTLRRLPKGARTELRHGGEPLTAPERARVLLARAMLGSPPLLVLDHLDADLGLASREFLGEQLRDYPGVVVLASDEPKEIVDPTHVWVLN